MSSSRVQPDGRLGRPLSRRRVAVRWTVLAVCVSMALASFGATLSVLLRSFGQ